MRRKINEEYIQLKKNISRYVDKYPTPNKEWNKKRLKALSDLKPKLGSPEVDKEFYKIRDSIILANGGFAMKYVTRYYSVMNEETSISELFQEATIGLIETIDAFDANRNASFTTYAYFHIRKRIIDFIKKNKLVKAPRDIARNMKHVNEAQGQLLAESGRQPTAADIVKHLKKEKNIVLKEIIVDKIMILLELNSSSSDDAFISEYKDQVPTEEDNELFREMELSIMSSIAKMKDITKNAICLRFGIGREYSHSPEEVRMILDLSKDHTLKLE